MIQEQAGVADWPMAKDAHLPWLAMKSMPAFNSFALLQIASPIPAADLVPRSQANTTCTGGMRVQFAEQRVMHNHLVCLEYLMRQTG